MKNKNQAQTCPKCNKRQMYKRGNGDYALSRDDNKTRVCSSCGLAEALEIFKLNIKE